MYKRSGPSSFVFNRTINQAATLGVTATSLLSGLTDVTDYHQTLDVILSNGSLSSVGRDELLSGANSAAVGTSASGFEIIQFANAVLVAPSTYRLSGLLRAQAGSGPEMVAVRSAGTNFVLLNAAVDQPIMTLAEAGQSADWRMGPAQLDYGSTAYAAISSSGGLKSLRPLSPAYFGVQKLPIGFSFTWIRRTRDSGDSWDLAEVPMGEANETYQLQIMRNGAVQRTVTTTSPNYLYAAADAVADFGTLPTSFSARITQVSTTFGPGAVTERTFNV